MHLKKNFYICSFGVLGLLMGVVVYGLGSMVLMQKNLEFDQAWYLGIMLVGGSIAGLFEGKRWWHIIYVEKAHNKWLKHMREAKLLGLVLLIIMTVAIVAIFKIRS
jgi:hypothetical protein